MARVQVRTYVDSALRDQWERKYDYASLSWLMQTAMEEVLQLTEGEPGLTEVVKAQIKAHILKHQFQPNRQRKPNVSAPTGA